MVTLNKIDQRTYDRALSTNDVGYIGRTLAILSRSGSKRTQDAVLEMIERYYDFSDFTMRNGALLHNSEV